jgi:hypothetical protein
MTSPQSPTRIYYEFATNYYEDEQCSIFNNSTSEKNYCNIYVYPTINECCDYIADIKNVILNICNDSIKYTCGYDEGVIIYPQEDFYTCLFFFCSITLIIFSIIFCMYSVSYKKKNFLNRSKYRTLNPKN